MSSVPVAIIADYALAHPDGKLYVTGGGIRSLSFSHYPAAYPRLSLAVMVEFDPSECGIQHAIGIETLGPDAKPFGRAMSLLLPPASLDLPVRVPFVCNFDPISFVAPGEYRFAILVDGSPQTAVSLWTTVSSGPTPAEAQAQGRLGSRVQAGFDAFGRGDIMEAQHIFEALTDEFPWLAVAHNNLGFVLLSRGQSASALDEFKQAAQYNFDRPELLDVNVGCCYYLMTDFTRALDMFTRAVSQRSFQRPAFLTGIKDTELVVVSLVSAADYVSLSSINAAWSALQLGNRDLALRSLRVAEDTQLAGSEQAQQLRDSLTMLRAKLEGPSS